MPTQLFETNNYLKEMDRIIMIEDFLTNQHKQKLVLHRASMKYYYNKLKTKFNDSYSTPSSQTASPKNATAIC